MKRFSVLISGAGLGGLCLAQALRRAGVEVQVFERDSSAWDRPQGYRLHIDSDGVQALAESLPPSLYALFEATSMRPQPFNTVVDSRFRELRRMPQAGEHLNVDRATLRQILLLGLEGRIHYGESLTHYASDEEGVSTFFSSGRTARGSVLVGADGIRSMVRAQRLPQAEIQDTGVRAIYGRIPMPRAVEVLPAPALSDVFTVAVDERKVFLGVGAVVFPRRPEELGLKACDDYMVCIVGAPHESFGRDDETLRGLGGGELKGLAESLVASWSTPAQDIPSLGDPSSFFYVEMFTSVPLRIAPSPNVTLLGDAIHAMTPTLGRGANVALRDAALLARSLKRAAEGVVPLDNALLDYESEMAAYGFDGVRESAALGAGLMGQNPLPES
jgi:2-polyprenyl-6-methoxyphenol hydroxylase-like FAD-dependent oxidoreductase